MVMFWKMKNDHLTIKEQLSKLFFKPSRTKVSYRWVGYGFFSSVALLVL
jgi:hypothetical protein